ncbi:Imm26 family immunity protein [Alkalimarinus sediminis]|uniref:Immunity 26/phosphotriesterase HocA family protein n=1 Tax=Alkalimarinus sediminis TaxID=1632866 RepID=A0A9E8HQ75_9ALTE|nr:Imm26 family immunity protein [Alkalimarinus sediminis]UZW74531.1 immunity 26/phosphotriesterase HocA family protein [Alkalimarinus sediminis]
MSKKQRRTIGSIFKLPVDDYFVHGQILDDTEIVVFDTKGRKIEDPGEIVLQPILFRVSANSDAILDGHWLKIGKAKISKELSKPIPRYIQDALSPDKYEIYERGVTRKATRDECLGLECVAVWAVNHVTDRVRDHYNGVPNVWLQQCTLQC